jgi:hypothetical protein
MLNVYTQQDANFKNSNYKCFRKRGEFQVFEKLDVAGAVEHINCFGLKDLSLRKFRSWSAIE